MAGRFILFTVATKLIFVGFCSNVANANLIVRPTDALVLVNQSTYFNCSTSDKNMDANYVLWYHYPMNSVPRIDVYDEGKIMPDYEDRFRIETNLSVGVVNLVIMRPNPADAGRYECQDGFGQGDKASAELIVLDGKPICQSSMNPIDVIGENDCGLVQDEIQLTCSVKSSHGNILPTLEWKLSGDESRSSLVVCEPSTSCNLTLQGNRAFNSQSLVCKTTKASQQSGCYIGPIQVKHAFSSRMNLTALGDVECYANTSQICSYVWKNADGKEVSSNENLGKQDPGGYRCEAKCEMSQQDDLCTFTAMEVNVIAPDHLSGAQLTSVLISIFIVVALLVVVGLLVCLWLYKSRRCLKCFGKQDHKEFAVLLTAPAAPDTVDSSSKHLLELSSLPNITDQGMIDKLTINKYSIDRGDSGVIYGPFRWKDKKCAFKQVLFSPDTLTEEIAEKVLQKSNRCKELVNPNLVKVFEVWFPQPALYILMEYAEGKSLNKLLRPKDASSDLQSLPPETVRDWAFQIANGMRYLHFKDLVHRNLKAAHVLVMEAPDVRPNRLKIGSYTPIKQHDHATVVSMRGTMAWMAPEYIRNEPFSKSSDVWSYGITVWEILTRDVPFREVKKETDLVKRAMSNTLKLEIPDSCPKSFRDLLTDCWYYEVDKRPSFQRICDDLRDPRKFSFSKSDVRSGAFPT